MKLLIAILITLAMVSITSAETYTFIEKSVQRKIEVQAEKDFLLVTVYPKDSKPIKFRVYPCGQIEMEQWKEIAPNKERDTIQWISGGSIQLAPYIETTLENQGVIQVK